MVRPQAGREKGGKGISTVGYVLCENIFRPLLWQAICFQMSRNGLGDRPGQWGTG